MDDLILNISDLVIRVVISGLKPRVAREIKDIFYPFLSENKDIPPEILEIIPVRKQLLVKRDKDVEGFIKASLKIPLSRFPFAKDLEKETDTIFRNLKPFLNDAILKALPGDIKKPEDVVIYPLNKDGLILKCFPKRTILLIKDGYRQMSKVMTICAAIYFMASISLPMAECFLLHGVGIMRNGAGHLFLGLSGDGKTTLTGFSPPEGVISDDGIIARRDGLNYYLDPAPLDQSCSFKAGLMTYPAEARRLAMGFFLEKDDSVYLERINPADACSIILKNHIHFFRYFPHDAAKKTFYLIAGLCRQVPFYKLHFRKDDSFWSVIDHQRDKII